MYIYIYLCYKSMGPRVHLSIFSSITLVLVLLVVVAAAAVMSIITIIIIQLSLFVYC